MPTVFINSRNEDGAYAASLLYDALVQRLDRDHVFKSNRSIPPGEDYAAMLLRQAAGCDVMLSVIGPAWLTAAAADGVRRLDQPDDWVFQEIAAAIGKGRRVIPLLLTGAAMPTAQDLPHDIRALASYQYRRLDHRNYPWDIARLIDDLQDLGTERTSTSRSDRKEPQMTHHIENIARDHAHVGNQIASISGNVYFGPAPAAPPDLGPLLDSLRSHLELAYRSGRLDGEAHREATSELDVAQSDASAADPEARGRFVRAMRRLERLVGDVGPLASLAATILAKVTA
ncbi:TIR domain-containing protein [Catellatospora paridis]|uniref:TIR domain-containing protein n=1 Tax=Catellatospora paridis TaxID=1617086 RepID=UPI0018AFD189|nr:TIR domain-containing protein [Catellatospora paridis]